MTTPDVRSSSGSLPITHDLTLAYLFSFVVALIMTAASAAGLLYQTAIYPTDELALSFVPSDAFNLAVGLPILLGSMWLARRGQLIGLLCWPGALFYVLYMYIPYLLGVPFNVLFLPYVALVALSAYTLIGLIASIDGEPVRRRLAGFAPAKASGGIFVGLAVFIATRQIALIVAALANQVSHNTPEVSSWIADFTVAVPLLLAGGILLWRRRALGYVAGAGLLLGYGVLALSVIPYLVLEARYTASSIDVAGVVVILAMAALCFIPFAFFVHGAASDRSSESAQLVGPNTRNK
jgi:hypothetical protein